ncbi:hypothetical protein FJ251_12955 [bacterium]|nr:hypothetical protein [bacterium]
MWRLCRAVLAQYRLDPADELHGLPHWARVARNGYWLAAATGVSPRLVEPFALLHDACRENEDRDPGHGPRAAALAAVLTPELLELAAPQIELLREACAQHTRGRTVAHPELQVCWDADRLDLVRLGFALDRRRLCTEAARAVAEGELRLPPMDLPLFLARRWRVDSRGQTVPVLEFTPDLEDDDSDDE